MAVTYTFIKMTCDPEKQSVTINDFSDEREEGKARIKRHEKDTYYVDENVYKEIVCDLGNKHTVSFVPIQSYEHPRDNTFQLYLDVHPPRNARFTVWSDLDMPLTAGNWKLSIHSSGTGYTVSYCPTFAMDYIFKEHEVNAPRRNPPCENLAIKHKTAADQARIPATVPDPSESNEPNFNSRQRTHERR